MLKTRSTVTIPIVNGLIDYLHSLPDDSEYVHQGLADRYLGPSRSAIGKDVSRFLNEIKIKTDKVVPGRKKAVKLKDVHSLRHTFCYMAAINGIPRPVVQSIVGHMSPAMTQRYMNHASMEDKREMLATMPALLGDGTRSGTTCLWTFDKRYDVWRPACGTSRHYLDLEMGTPKENLFKFCPYCGKTLEEK
jgi:integrase